MANSEINLKKGWPNPDLLPVDLIREAAVKSLSDPAIAVPGLLYGPDPGYEPCREAVAAWLTGFYKPKDTIPVDRICITGGASQNLGLMLDVYTDPQYTRNIWIVSPAYMLAFRMMEDSGFGGKLRAVPENDHGIDIDYLRREIALSEDQAVKDGNDKPKYKPERKSEKIYKHVIYCVPTFANPSSKTWSLDKRRELVKVAREFDALVISDDVYDFLQWRSNTKVHMTEGLNTAVLPRLVDVDRELEGGPERDGADGFGNTVSNGSFSKIAGPGLRVGWIEASKKFTFGTSVAGIQSSGGAPSQLTSTYLAEMLKSGNLQHHIKTVLQPAYASRWAKLMGAVSTHLVPLGFSLPQADREIVGGYFTWLSLPEGLGARALSIRCKDEENIVLAPGSMFEVPDKVKGDLGFGTHVRLCWAWEDESKLEDAVKRIGVVAKKLLDDPNHGEDDYVVVDGMDSIK